MAVDVKKIQKKVLDAGEQARKAAQDSAGKVAKRVSDGGKQAKKAAQDGVDIAAKKIADGSDQARRAVKSGVDIVADKAADTRDDFDRKRLKPVFVNKNTKPIISNNPADPTNYPLIIVRDMDSAHKNSPVCKNSDGHVDVIGRKKVLTIYPSRVKRFGLEFYPDPNGEVYYVNPINPTQYIYLDDYFAFIRKEKSDPLS